MSIQDSNDLLFNEEKDSKPPTSPTIWAIYIIVGLLIILSIIFIFIYRFFYFFKK